MPKPAQRSHELVQNGGVIPLFLGLAMMQANDKTIYQPLPKLEVKGKHLVDPSGKVVPMKGVNLGNWLMIELWMWGFWDEETGGVKDQHDLLHTLRERFGPIETERLMDVYRASWFTDRDFEVIRSFGMNVVRLPIDYRLLEGSEPKTLRPDAWEWIDRAVDMAEAKGLYTILDLHGAPGGQSPYEHTGQSDQNKLWAEPANHERTAWLWGEMSKRFRDRSAVVAYDVINEPYGGKRDEIWTVFEKCLAAIRKVDPDKLVYAPGDTSGFDFYGDPKANGWKNVGFTMHYYPGLFGNGQPTPLTHAKHLRYLETVAEQVEKLNVPFLVGEMNVVFKAAGGGSMMRRTFDLHEKFGWATTMWSTKVVSREGGLSGAMWGLVTTKNPGRTANFRKDSKEAIEAFFKGFATEELVVYEELRQAMTAKNPVLPALPEIPAPRRVAPADDPIAPWLLNDVGGALQGGQRTLPNGDIELYGGGDDIWAHRDQFRFLVQPVAGDFALAGTVVSLEDVDAYSKAGLMARVSREPDAAALLVSTFPNGEVQVALRRKTGEAMEGVASLQREGFPVSLRLTRRDEEFAVAAREASGAWKELWSGKLDWPVETFVGAVALSHDNSQLVRAVYRGLMLRK